MKKIIKAMVYALLTLVIVYIAFAFVLWELNPGKWSWDARYFMAGFGGLISIAAAGVVIIADDENE